jgi:ketosteroid isomerase-like protein
MSGLLLLTCLLGTEPDSLHRLALERALGAFSAAFLRADENALDTLLTDDYVHTNGGNGSVLDKARWLEYIRTRRAEVASGRLRVDRYESTQATIRWHGNAAVVTSQVVSEGSRDGQPFATRLRVTQVWIRLGGQWRRAAFHDSPLDLPGPDARTPAASARRREPGRTGSSSSRGQSLLP